MTTWQTVLDSPFTDFLLLKFYTHGKYCSISSSINIISMNNFEMYMRGKEVDVLVVVYLIEKFGVMQAKR